MKKVIFLFALFALPLAVLSQIPDLESNETPTYHELIKLYEEIDATSDFVDMTTYGMTDAGYPLHLLLINKDKVFDPSKFDPNKVVFLINNGIHPGEPCGVNASLHIVEEMSKGINIPDNVILAIIPAYNIGGMLNRGSHSRANQNGPEAYGFRGNAQNLDLNRDFIKADSKNAFAFYDIFQALKPHIFLDTHTSNGSDYQYTMTLITSQPEMAGSVIGPFAKHIMTPFLMKDMDKRDWPMAPYVNTIKGTPDHGIADFPDSPRYSTGYTSLFNTLSFVSETHMLKPFADRVKSTYALIHSMTEFGDVKSEDIINLKNKANETAKKMRTYPLSWELDTNHFENLSFRGYESAKVKSSVTTGERLLYDRDQPFEKDIQYFNTYKVKTKVKQTQYYIIPQGWHKIIERLQKNNVNMTALDRDSSILVSSYHLGLFETRTNPFEGHYQHYNTNMDLKRHNQSFRKGDFVVKMDQDCNKFIAAVLEPEATDSYFNWNFFDVILQQKEWYSGYVFEDIAAKMIQDDPELKIAFDEEMKDPEFAINSRGQLYWLYQKSPHYEPIHRRYPVYRVD